MIARQSDRSTPENLGSAGDPSSCPPGERDFTRDGHRMGSSSPVGGGGGVESRPGNMRRPGAEIESGPQARVTQTHQTHLIHPAIPRLPRQTYLMKCL